MLLRLSPYPSRVSSHGSEKLRPRSPPASARSSDAGIEERARAVLKFPSGLGAAHHGQQNLFGLQRRERVLRHVELRRAYRHLLCRGTARAKNGNPGDRGGERTGRPLLSLRSLPPGDLRIRTRGGGLLSRQTRMEGIPDHATAAGRISPEVSDSPRSLGGQGAGSIRVLDVIRKKRDGGELSRAEIDAIVNGYTRGEVPDYQVSSWLMATFLRGLTRAET